VVARVRPDGYVVIPIGREGSRVSSDMHILELNFSEQKKGDSVMPDDNPRADASKEAPASLETEIMRHARALLGWARDSVATRARESKTSLASDPSLPEVCLQPLDLARLDEGLLPATGSLQ
jgi:hypothetical protein